MSANCPFCLIAQHEMRCHLVHEDDEVIAFLDVHPVRTGHSLIIPRSHFRWFEEIPLAIAARITEVAQLLARTMKPLYGVERVAMLYTGIHIAHAHAHVIPLHHPHDVTSTAYLKGGPFDFALPPSPPEKMLADVAATLRAEMISHQSRVA